MQKVIFLLFISLALVSCKTEITEEIHEYAVVKDNQVPDFQSISTLQIENYVNKLYIDLIGVEPTESELNTTVNDLKNAELQESARVQIIEKLLGSPKYFNQLFEQTSSQFIEGISKDQIRDQIFTFGAIRNQSLQNGDTLAAEYFTYLMGLLDDLFYSDNALESGTITRSEFFGRFCYNYFYDEINMGSENFVKATFENLLGRLPTEAELSNGIAMVDGTSSQVLLQDGNSKPDFIKIVSTSNEYYNHWINDQYQYFLGRDPNADELEEAFHFLANEQYNQVLVDILKSDAYAGF